MSATPLVLTGELTLEQVDSAATEPRPVELADAALSAVADNRTVLVDEIALGTPIYGITTGFGALVTRELPPAKVREAQLNLLRSHAAGCGAPLPRAAVRAALIVRLNGLLQARSAIRPVILRRVAELLNADLVPVVPRTGSLGASGDLAPSAHAFLPLVGEGQVVDAAGQLLSGAEALRRLAAEPLVLEAKEALALINGTHFMAGIAALVSRRIARALDSADVAAALSIAALGGASAALDMRAHRLRGLAGQLRSARNIGSLLGDSANGPPPQGALQDAYSLRCAAQVHGAAREATEFFDRIATADVNAVTDNPLVFAEPPRVVSAGNFHGQALALALDTVRVAMADLASISERRTFRLVSPTLNNGLPAFLSSDPGPSSGYMVAQYTAAALVSELRALAHPVSCDSIPTSDNQEDHVSMGMTAATMALDAVDRLETVLAIELVCAAQAGEGKDGPVPAAHRVLRERVPPLEADRAPAGDIAAAVELLRAGTVAAVLSPGARRAAVA